MSEFTRRTFLAGGAAAAISSRALHAGDEGSLKSPITNRWGEAKTTKLDLEEIRVFKGPPGAAYNHHHQILFNRGRLYASWSNGVTHEDNPGQRMLFAVSDDEGKTWSSETEISAPPPEKSSTYTAMGIRSYEDRLIAYYGHFAYNPIGFDANGVVIGKPILEHRGDAKIWVRKNTFCDLRTSRDRGATWDKPMRVLDKFVPNLRPFPLRNGRLMMTGNITFPYTDDPVGIRGWKTAGLPRLPKWTVDDPEGFLKACSYRKDPRDYCEGSFFQTDDGKIHMMLRTLPIGTEKHNGLLAVTESANNGKTWSEPRLTSYTDCSCRFHFGRLPNGQFFGLSCPNPKGARTPMVLATSRDGVVFDRHYILGDAAATKPRLPGHAKGGAYGYPSCDIANGKMYIVFSRNKEDIYFTKLSLDSLS
jgi:hypothetical protein